MPIEGKKHILSSACTKWRQFKFKLRKKILNPFQDRRPLFDNPPKNYSFIKKKKKKDAWNAFVSRYSSLEFHKWSRLQSEKAKSNEYRSHSSRHGFVNVEENIVSVEYLVLHR